MWTIEVLTAALAGLFCLFFLYIRDSSVYDADGVRIPGKRSHFDAPNFKSVMMAARSTKQAGLAMYNTVLPDFGNGSVAAVAIPFASSDFSSLFRRRLVITADPDMVKSVSTLSFE